MSTWVNILIFLSISVLGGGFYVLCLENIGYGFRKGLDFLFGKVLPEYERGDSEETGILEELPLNLVVGMITLGMLYFFMGLIHLLYEPVVIVIPIFLALTSFLITKRRFSNSNGVMFFKQFSKHDRAILYGALILSIPVFIFTLRPPIDFDAVWYHLTIPKFFLQENSIGDLGEHLRYSVHPNLNFFTSLWALALPIQTYYSAVIINVFQSILIIFSIIFSLKKITKLIQIPPWGLYFMPLFMGLTTETLAWLGAGYNDLYAYAVALMALFLLAEYNLNETLSLRQYGIILLLLVTLSLYKVFFILSAGLILIYSLFVFIPKLSKGRNLFQTLFTMLFVSVVIGGVFFLPWLVRSYVETGRILDPVGDPRLNEDVYTFAGSLTPINHWNIFVWQRFVQHLPYILILAFSPLMLVSLFSKINIEINKKLNDIWVLCWTGFSTLYFLSIVTQWRYFFAFTGGLVTLGGIFIVKHFDTHSIYSRVLVILSLCAFIIGAPLIYDDTFFEEVYAFNLQKTENFVKEISLLSSTMFYPSSAMSPDDLKSDEKIWVASVHSMAYIDNPILDIRQAPEEFENITTTDELVEMLKNNKIRYLLYAGSLPLNEYCNLYLRLEDYQECDKKFENIKYDLTESITWFRVK